MWLGGLKFLFHHLYFPIINKLLSQLLQQLVCGFPTSSLFLLLNFVGVFWKGFYSHILFWVIFIILV